MKKRSPVPGVVAAILMTALLCTVLVEGGWLVWLPVLLALAVVGMIGSAARRP